MEDNRELPRPRISFEAKDLNGFSTQRTRGSGSIWKIPSGFFIYSIFSYLPVNKPCKYYRKYVLFVFIIYVHPRTVKKLYIYSTSIFSLHRHSPEARLLYVLQRMYSREEEKKKGRTSQWREERGWKSWVVNDTDPVMSRGASSS